MNAAEHYPLDLLVAFDIGHAGARKNCHAHHRGARQQIRGNFPAVVSDGHGNARFREIKRRQVSRVIVGNNQGTFEGRQAIAVEIGANGGRQHHAGTVIVGENQRALDGTGCEDDGFRPK